MGSLGPAGCWGLPLPLSVAPLCLFPPLPAPSPCSARCWLRRSLKAQEDDFGVALEYDPAGPLPPALASRDVAQYAVRGVAAATAKYRDNATAPLKVRAMRHRAQKGGRGKGVGKLNG